MLHIDTLSTAELRELVDFEQDPCISLFMPTHRSGAMSEDRTRFRNLLRAAEGRVREQGAANSAEILRPAYALLEDTRYWSFLCDGLSLHLSSSRAFIHRLPVSVPELVWVGRRFYVKPLFALDFSEDEFYLLTLGEKGCALFRGTRLALEKLEVAGLPQSLADALKFEDLNRQLRVHTGDVEKGGGVFHVQGGSNEEAIIKRWLRDYCSIVDRAVTEYLGDRNSPLLVAAAEPIFSIYREHSRCRQFLPHNVRANFKHASNDELHRVAWGILEVERKTQRDAQVRRYAELRGRNLAVSGLAELLPACVHGQVDTLFMDFTRERFGRFDAQRNSLEAEETPGHGREPLYDLAARSAWLNGAAIYPLASGEPLAGDAGIAGILRYAFLSAAAEGAA